MSPVGFGLHDFHMVLDNEDSNPHLSETNNRKTVIKDISVTNPCDFELLQDSYINELVGTTREDLFERMPYKTILIRNLWLGSV